MFTVFIWLTLVIASVRHAWLYYCVVRAMRKILKSSSDGGDSGSSKCKRGYSGALVVSGGVWSQAVGFFVGAFGRNLASVAAKMFSHLIYYKKKFLYFQCDLQR
jgi:hypothetical protein